MRTGLRVRVETAQLMFVALARRHLVNLHCWTELRFGTDGLAPTLFTTFVTRSTYHDRLCRLTIQAQDSSSPTCPMLRERRGSVSPVRPKRARHGVNLTGLPARPGIHAHYRLCAPYGTHPTYIPLISTNVGRETHRPLIVYWSGSADRRPRERPSLRPVVPPSKFASGLSLAIVWCSSP